MHFGKTGFVIMQILDSWHHLHTCILNVQLYRRKACKVLLWFKVLHLWELVRVHLRSLKTAIISVYQELLLTSNILHSGEGPIPMPFCSSSRKKNS